MMNLGITIAGFDVGPLITLIIFIIVILNIVRQARRHAREQAEEERPEPRPEAEQPADQIQKFLEELGRRTGTPVPPRPRPARPARTAPLARPVPPTRTVEKRPRPVEPERRVTSIEERVIKPTVRPTVKPTLTEKIVRPSLETAAPTVQVETRPAATIAAAERIKALLRDDPLKQAMSWRIILGPCRAMRPWRPLEYRY